MELNPVEWKMVRTQATRHVMIHDFGFAIQVSHNIRKLKEAFITKKKKATLKLKKIYTFVFTLYFLNSQQLFPNICKRLV